MIVATGASARWLDVPRRRAAARPRRLDVRDLRRRVLPRQAHRRRRRRRLGDGRSALPHALRHARSRSSTAATSFRASKIMADRVLAHAKIDVIWNSEVVEVLGDGADRRRSACATSRPARRRTIDADALFIAIGHDPNTAIFRGQLDLDPTGYIASPDGVTTNVPGVFVAGDVFDIRYKQAITAAGSGLQSRARSREISRGSRGRTRRGARLVVASDAGSPSRPSAARAAAARDHGVHRLRAGSASQRDGAHRAARSPVSGCARR